MTSFLLVLALVAHEPTALLRVEPRAEWHRSRTVASRPGSSQLVFPSHGVVGYEQRARRLRDGRTEVTVVVDPSPRHSRAPWPGPSSAPDAERWLRREANPEDTDTVRALAEEITLGSRWQHEVAERILTWVSLNIAHSDAPGHDESAASTGREGTASCVGRSRLAVDLLRAAGLPARTVHGILLPRRTSAGSVLGSAEFVLHRHVECWIDDLGWVPSDPGESVHLIDARHLVLGPEDESYDPEAQRRVLLSIVTPATTIQARERRLPHDTPLLFVRGVAANGRTEARRP